MAKRKFCEIAYILLNFIKLAGWQLSRVAIGWMKIFPGGNFPGRIFPGCELPGWDLSWVGIFFAGSFPGGNRLGGSFHVTQPNIS